MRAGKGFTLFFSNEDMNDVDQVIKPLENSNVLIDDITATVKYEIKKRWGRVLLALLAPLADSLVQPIILSVLKGMSGIAVTRAGRHYNDIYFLIPVHPLSNIKITTYFLWKLRFNGAFSKNN